ncbi:hypothetical protein ABBQ38_000430 [Trebouxia sp. C0009 RCD-2024]
MADRATERFTSQALDDAERGSAIVKVVTKRIRAANKRMKKIEATEAKAQSQPDTINQDQKELLDSKAKTMANIEELERLIPLLQEAEGEGKLSAINRAVEKALADERASVAAQVPSAPAEPAPAEPAPAEPAPAEPVPAKPAEVSDEAKREVQSRTIEKLLHLLYFSQTFDFDKPGELTSLERNACLCYYNQHPDRSTPLTPEDFGLLCKLGSRMVSRPTTECVSHSEALEQARHLAMQWLHPSDTPVDVIDGRSMSEVAHCLERMMDSDYISVRPVLAQPAPQHAPDSIPPSSDPLQPQDSHTFSDASPPTEPSPQESPIPPESSQSHHAPSDHPNGLPYQEQSYGQPHPDHDYYPHPQNGYAAPEQPIPNGQDYHTGSAPALNFMNGSSLNNGQPGSAHSQDLGSAFSRASVQDEVPDSTYTNGHLHLPSVGSQGLPEDRPTPFQAPLQGSQAPFGTRERGDGGRGPERQGSYSRGRYGGGAYEGGAPRGRGGGVRGRADSAGRGEYMGRGLGRRGRGDSFRGRGEHYRGRGSFGSGGANEYGRGLRGGFQRSQQHEAPPPSGY